MGGKFTENPAVRTGFMQRRDRRAIKQEVQVTVGRMNIKMFQLRRCWQHDVGIVGGIGLEVFNHYGEQILAGETAAHRAAVRRHRHRIAVEHDQGFKRGLFGGQCVADGTHVDQARSVSVQQVGARHGVVSRHPAAGREHRAAAALAPVSGQCRQRHDGAHGIATAGIALHAVIEPDGSRSRARIRLRQGFNLRRIDITPLRSTLR